VTYILNFKIFIFSNCEWFLNVASRFLTSKHFYEIKNKRVLEAKSQWKWKFITMKVKHEDVVEKTSIYKAKNHEDELTTS